MRRPSGERAQEESPVVELVVDLGCERDAVAGALEGDVKTGEQSESPGQHGRYTAQVPAEDLPGEQRAALGGARELGEDAADLGVPFGRKGDEISDGVNEPAQEFFLRGPIGIPKLEFLDRVWGFAVPVVFVVGPKEQVKAVKNMPSRLPELVGVTLPQGKKVIDEDVDVGEGIATGSRARRGRERNGGSFGEPFERVRRRKASLPPRVVDEVGCGFGSRAKEGSGLNKTHRQGQVKADKGFRIAGMLGDHEGELGQVRDI
jgi:hypothetical protein